MSDIFARSNARQDRVDTAKSREAEATASKTQATARIAANKARADALARPQPVYKANLPMRSPT